MSQILRCDWLPEHARSSDLALPGLPPFGLLFFDFLVFLRENAQQNVRRTERYMKSSWCSVNFVLAIMNAM